MLYVRLPHGIVAAEKISDNIEELCDEFEAVNVTLSGDKFKRYESVEEAENDKSFLYDYIYGIIFDDGIRIRVAKKYGSREWELL